MADEKYMWMREYQGGGCEDCEKDHGKLFESEAEAKQAKHPRCKCTAKPIPKCNNKIKMGLGSLTIENVQADYSGLFKKEVTITFSATAINNCKVPLENIKILLQVHVAGDKLHEETFPIGTMEPGSTHDVESSITLDKSVAKELRKKIKEGCGVSVLFTATYSEPGKEPTEKTSGCWL